MQNLINSGITLEYYKNLYFSSLVSTTHYYTLGICSANQQ